MNIVALMLIIGAGGGTTGTVDPPPVEVSVTINGEPATINGQTVTMTT